MSNKDVSFSKVTKTPETLADFVLSVVDDPYASQKVCKICAYKNTKECDLNWGYIDDCPYASCRRGIVESLKGTN